MENGNLEGLYLSTLKVNQGTVCVLSSLHGDQWLFELSHFLAHKRVSWGGEVSLNIAVFQDHRTLMKLNIVTIHFWTSQMSTFWAIFALKTLKKKKNKTPILQIQ